MRGQVGSKAVRFRVVAVQHGHQVADVGRGQPERFDLRQLGVGRHVGYAIPEVGERVVDALRPAPFLLVGRVPALDHAHHRHHRRLQQHRRRCQIRSAALLKRLLPLVGPVVRVIVSLRTLLMALYTDSIENGPHEMDGDSKGTISDFNESRTRPESRESLDSFEVVDKKKKRKLEKLSDFLMFSVKNDYSLEIFAYAENNVGVMRISRHRVIGLNFTLLYRVRITALRGQVPAENENDCNCKYLRLVEPLFKKPCVFKRDFPEMNYHDYNGYITTMLPD